MSRPVRTGFRTATEVMSPEPLRFAVDWAARLGRYDMVWGKPHGLPSDWRCGAPLGNGDLGAMVYGSPDNLSFALGKNGLWDRHHEGRSTFKGTCFADVVRAYFAHDHELFRKRCAEPEPKEKQHATTAGMFRLHLHDGDGAMSCDMRLTLYDGVATLTFTPTGIEPGLRFWGRTEVTMLASRAYEVLAIRVQPTPVTVDPVRQWCPQGLSAPLGQVTWELARAPHPPHPSAKPHVVPPVVLLTQELAAGDRYVIAVRLLGGLMRAWAVGDRLAGDVTVAGDAPLVALLTIVAHDESPQPDQLAQERLDRAARAGFETILARHVDWWHAYWRRGYAVVEDPVIERSYFISLYHCGAILEPDKHSPGLQGPWIKENVPAWLGDYHSNVNLQSVYWGLLANNRLDAMEPYVRCLQRMAPQAYRDTQRYFGMRGIRFPHAGSIDGFELTYGDWATNLGVSVGGSAWLTQLLWQIYEYTGDADYLRNTAWPLLRDVAVFYEDYLRWDQATGRYALEPSVFFESLCPTFACWGRDSLYELALVYGAFQRGIAAAELVGGAEATTCAHRWREILAKLPPFPTEPETDSWISFAGRDVRCEHAHGFALPPVFPADLVSLWHGPASWRQQALNTLQHPTTIKTGTGQAWCGGQGLREMIRLGAVDRVLAALRTQDLCNDPNHVNGLGHAWDSHYLQVDHAPGFCSVLPDMLLLGLSGVIRLFPCWPTDLSAAFHSLRVPGPFLVSAERRGAEVAYAMFQSLTGAELCVANPWPTAAEWVDLADGRVVPAGTAAELRRPTVTGQRLLLRRAGTDPMALPIHLWT